MTNIYLFIFDKKTHGRWRLQDGWIVILIGKRGQWGRSCRLSLREVALGKQMWVLQGV